MLSFKGQEGASTIMMVMISAVMMTTVGTTLNLLDKRSDYLEIVRIQSQLELTEHRLRSSASSLGGLKVSAQRQVGNSALRRCLRGSVCNDMDAYQEYTLYDAGGRRLSGKVDLNGNACEGDSCPLEVRASYQLKCASNVSRCRNPAEVRTKYSIEKLDSKSLSRRKIQSVEGSVSAASFTCPDNQYVHSMSDDGQLSCRGAYASRSLSICPKGTVAYGIDDNGLFKCTSIANYCQEPIAFTYILDTSRSMKKRNKLEDAKAASKTLLAKLGKGDRSALTSYSTTATNIASLTGRNNEVISGMDVLRAKGRTNMSAGLMMGAKELEGIKRDKKVMVFLSDGLHNTGDVDPVDAAKIVKDSGVRIFTIGFGKKADEDRLMRIASSPADYFKAENAGSLEQAFQSIADITCR